MSTSDQAHASDFLSAMVVCAFYGLRVLQGDEFVRGLLDEAGKDLACPIDPDIASTFHKPSAATAH